MSEVIVSDLIQWLEGQLQLSEAIKVDAIAAKSGYSKWYLQREFKQKRDFLLQNMFASVVYMRPLRCFVQANSQLLILHLNTVLAHSKHLVVYLELTLILLLQSFVTRDCIQNLMKSWK